MPQNPSLEQLFQQIQQAMVCDQWFLRTQLRKLAQVKPQDPMAWMQYKDTLARSIMRSQQRQQAVPIIHYPAELPIVQHTNEIAAALHQHQVIIVAGETGSGKTTQLPKLCLALGRGIKGYIGHTQPRRVAARTVATRIAEELTRPLGQYVGYKVRFTEQIHTDAYIKLMTDGILLAELQKDRFLSHYDTLIIDEAHERSLNIDFILGYLKQLLPRRPDLKVIVTSATLDPERFAQYFNQAPIIQVSGRTYPVEILYKPLLEDEEQDVISAVVTTATTLMQQEPGDILVFLSGEREIYEVTEALRKCQLAHTEILPLYSRLSVAEQNKIFQAHTGWRIVLATNVAETSLTVPGIRYVIDAGYARIKRYSYRSKIQRLPIEPISQASAKQRSGRCGRIGPGICVRLYAEDDLLARPEFTEPEILRSNLAAVILQMASLRLGPLENFPFINPPDSRLIRDGYKLLEELGAIKTDKSLTPLGMRLAKLPVDPRLARMLLGAEQQACLTEVLIIVSGLSIQDPRERPLNWQQAADEKHRQYADERSDFLSFLNLWQVVKTQQQLLSHKKFRQFCRDNFLSYLRLREWQDIHAQLSDSIHELKLRCNQQVADYEAIHKAILTGLLGNIGYKQDDSSYLGSRNIKFAVFPGSAVYKKKPRWLMTLEIVETTKLYARTVAQIEPAWIEQLGDHLIKRNYFEPHWEKRRNQVVAFEKKILYGLVINPGKRINYGAIDPILSREIFIREALVQGQFASQATFYQHNLNLLEQLEELEHKARRRDILIDEQTLYDFYTERLPATIYDGISFEKWQKVATAQAIQLLLLTQDYLVQQQQDIIEQFPESLFLNKMTIKLHYRFEPGHVADGITAIIPLSILNQLEDGHFDWLVPGLLKDKIIALIKSLPKAIRRSFIPAVNYAEACLQALVTTDKEQPLTLVLTQHLQRITGVRVADSQWQFEQLPPHLLMNFQIIDTEQKLLAEGRNLAVLREHLAGKVQAHLQTLPLVDWEQDNIVSWNFATLPEQIITERAGLKVVAYPALIEQAESVSLRLLADKTEAESLNYFGLRKLFFLTLSKEISYLKKNIAHLTQLILYFKPMGSKEELLTDLINAAIQLTFLEHEKTIRSNEVFAAILSAQSKQFIINANTIAHIVLQSLEAYTNIIKQLKQSNPQTKEDIQQQLAALLYKSFIAATPYPWLVRLPIYLKGILVRLSKTGSNMIKEQQSIQELQRFYLPYQQHLKQHPHCKLLLNDFRWLLEEYRISLFAQELKTIQPISNKRLEKLWQQHIAEHHG